jgi:serine/threonine-protein kinase
LYVWRVSEPLDHLNSILADRYRIERELGAGGMATVYLAHDVRHDRKVALKVLKPELAAVIGPARFLAEIKTTANLQNPHILPLHDSGVIDGTVYYVMPFVEGESLRDRITREKQLPIPDAIRITTAVADALQYAHSHNVIHRDIKPENILLHDGHALVADFGIALAAKTADSRLTETGMSLGTPHYMSPEQAMGERDLDARSDIYALGCVLYEMLTGQPPFTGPTAQSIAAKVITEEPVPPSRMRGTVDETLDDAVLTALEKLPADRFPTAAAFANALAGNPSTSTIRRHQRKTIISARKPWTVIATATAAVMLALIALSGWALMHDRRPSSAPTVYDAALPDSAPMAFVSAAQSGYGLAVTNISIASDGSFVVYSAATGDNTILWWRSLRDTRTRAIPGTEGAENPQISPDGSRVAFISNKRVMVVPIAGGTPKQLFVAGIPATLQWTSPAQLLLVHSDGTRLTWLDVDAGTVKDLTIFRCTLGKWLPESMELLCGLNGTAWTVDPETGKQNSITVRSSDGSNAGYAQGSDFRVIDGRYIVYMSTSGELTAASYDLKARQMGRSVPLIPGVRRESAGSGQFDIAENGTLAYTPGDNTPLVNIVKMEKGKEAVPLPIETNFFQRFDLTMNGRWLAGIVIGPQSQELRIYDLKNGQSFTWLRAISFRHALWNREGTKILAFLRDGTHAYIVYGSPWSNAAPDTLLTDDPTKPFSEPVDFPDDHHVLAYDTRTGVSQLFDPSVHPAKLDPLDLQVRFAIVSPGGKFVAYQGRDNRIMVTSFPPKSDRFQVASDGVEPMWLSDSEILFRSGISWYSSRVNPLTGEPTGTPELWGKDPRFSDTSGWSNRASHDGGIIYAQGPPQSTARFIRVVPDWINQMKAAVDSVNR